MIDKKQAVEIILKSIIPKYGFEDGFLINDFIEKNSGFLFFIYPKKYLQTNDRKYLYGLPVFFVDKFDRSFHAFGNSFNLENNLKKHLKTKYGKSE